MSRIQRTLPPSVRYVPEHCWQGCRLHATNIPVPPEKVTDAPNYRTILAHLPHDQVGADVASGLGIGTGWLARISSRVTGVEISTDRLQEAENNNHGASNIDWVQKDLDQIPPESGVLPEPVDWITSFHTIEHLADPAAFLRSINHTLKRGGLLFLGFPLGQTTDLNPFHRQDLALVDILELLDRNGFATQNFVLSGEVQPLSWGNPFDKQGRILPNVVTRNILLSSLLRTYFRHPEKFLHRLASIARYRGFPKYSALITAKKI